MQRVRDVFALAKATIFSRTPEDSAGAPQHSLRSPVPHLFQSNAAPTHGEESLIHEAIMSTSNALALFEEQLSARDQQHHKKLHAQKAALAAFAQQHKQLLSPLRRLPTEILAEIFMYLIFPTIPPTNNKVPWQLCCVSRSWQVAALSKPLLWTEVYVNITKNRKDRRAESYLLHLNLLLERSREALLHVYIDASRSPDIQNHPLVKALVPHCTRWRRVSIKCTPPSLAAFQGIRGRLPNLSMLFLDLSPYQEEGSIDLFEVAPKLSNVHLDGLVGPCDIRLPWSQLTSMWDKAGTRLGIRHVCVLASNQITDIHYGTSGRVGGPTSVPTATLDKLHTLALDLRHGEHLHDFDNLTLPAVTTIQIAGYVGRLLPKLQAMVSRSATPSVLRKLAFRTTQLEPGDLGSILEYTPQLEELDTPLPSPDDLSRLVIRRQGPRPLVPNLRVLKIFAIRTHFGSYSNIINLLATSRCDLQPIPQHQLDVNSLCGQLSQPLDLRIVFTPDPEVWAQRIEELEANRSPTISHEGVNSEIRLLANWRDQLEEHVPSLMPYGPVHEKKLSRKNSRNMGQLLSQMERHQLTHVESLHKSKLHLSLQRLSKLWPETAGDKKYRFSERADQIVKGWEPILCADLHNRRWAHLGVNSITYVPISSPLRTSPRAMTIIYGLSDDSLHIEIHRPDSMLFD